MPYRATPLIAKLVSEGGVIAGASGGIRHPALFFSGLTEQGLGSSVDRRRASVCSATCGADAANLYGWRRPTFVRPLCFFGLTGPTWTPAALSRSDPEGR